MQNTNNYTGPASALSLLLAWTLVGCGEELRCEPGATPSRTLGTAPAFAPHQVRTVEPANYASGSGSELRIQFASPIGEADVHVHGEHSGAVLGTLQIAGDTLVFTPDLPLMSGERVTAIVPKSATAADGTLLAPRGYSWQFYVQPVASRAPLTATTFVERERHSTEGVSGNFSQTYGGVTIDLDRNGFADLVLVNEHSDDVVTFINSSDGLVSMERQEGTLPTGHGPSPSHAADFDGDGYVDLAVANTRDDVVSLYRGGADGLLTRWQDIPTGCQPRGITIADVNGDGLDDILTADYIDDSVSIHINAGGTFLTRVVLPTPTIDGDWAIGAGDIDNDGVPDLVIGGHDDGSITAYMGQGEGHFTEGSQVRTPPGLWHLNAADLNGDGIADVAVAGGHSGIGSLILSEREGIFGPATTHTTDPGNASTDLGDLDGDGDLDWVLSSFSTSNSDWSFFENDGRGNFQRFLEVDSPEDASCCILVDFDRDGDLDAALIDEADDVLILLENQ